METLHSFITACVLALPLAFIIGVIVAGVFAYIADVITSRSE